MAVDQTANFVRINVDGTHTDTDTTIQLETGEASELPDPANGEYNLTWWNDTFADHPSDDENVEIVRVTGVDAANDTITVQRGQEDTTAVAHDNSQAQYRMVLSATAGLFDQFEDVTNLDGSAGTSNQFLKTDGTSLSFATPPKGMTKTERQAFNGLVAQLARNDFEDNLSALNYDGGFYEIFRDTSKITEQSNVTVSTLDGGDNNGTVNLPKKFEIFEGFEDGDVSEWNLIFGSNFSATSSNPITGSFSGKLVDKTTAEYELSSAETQTLSFRYRPENVADYQQFYIFNSSGQRIGILDFGSNGDLKWFDGSSYNTLQSFSTGQTYDVILKWDFANNQVTINFDGTDYGPYSFDNNSSDWKNIQWQSPASDNTGVADDFVFGEIASNPYKTSGYVRSTEFDLADDGFSSAPTSVVVSQDVSLNDQDINYIVEGGSGGTQTITQSEVDTEVDISGNISSTKIQIKTELSGDGSDTPELDDEMFHFRE